MSEHDVPPGPLAAVLEALNTTTDELRAAQAEVARLRRYGRHNRTFIVVDILLTVLLSGVGALSVHAIQSAGHANSAQLALCRAGNVSRAQQVQLWDYVLKVSAAGKPQTAQQQQAAAAFRVYLHKTFAPRDCNRLGR